MKANLQEVHQVRIELDFQDFLKKTATLVRKYSKFTKVYLVNKKAFCETAYTLFSCISERPNFWLRMDISVFLFKNILRISAPNVSKTFLSIIASIGCTFVIFHSHKPTGNINTLPRPARKQHSKYM